MGTLGGNYSTASSINNAGVIVGQATTQTGQYHAFLYKNGAMSDIGTLGTSSYAYAINDAGQIVGYFYDGSEYHAFLYNDGVMLDLNDFIDDSLNFTLTNARDINEYGDIVGSGIDANGETHAFLLYNNDAHGTPVPEPLTIILSACGLISLLIRKIR